MDELFYGGCWDWHGHRLYMGPGYGACGYYNGRVNVWGGNNNININRNVNINNIQNNVNTSIRAGSATWRPGTGTSAARYSGYNGYAASPAQALRPGGAPVGGPPPARPTFDSSRLDNPAQPGFDSSRWDNAARKAADARGYSGFDVSSGSQARRESQRGAQSLQSMGSWQGQRGSVGTGARAGGRRR